MMAAQAMGAAPYYYYAQEPRPDVRQHAHFSHPPAMHQMPMYPAVPTLPSTPIYSRPASACSQPQGPTLYSNGTANLTPMASPVPMTHKPTIMLETEVCDAEYYPSTPPLSTSGSVISSPSSCDVLQTPMNPMFSGLDGMDSLKTEFEPVESLVLDWASCGSPPMTPGKSARQFPDRAKIRIARQSRSQARREWLSLKPLIFRCRRGARCD
jgi:C2H2 transcription facotor